MIKSISLDVYITSFGRSEPQNIQKSHKLWDMISTIFHEMDNVQKILIYFGTA